MRFETRTAPDIEALPSIYPLYRRSLVVEWGWLAAKPWAASPARSNDSTSDGNTMQ